MPITKADITTSNCCSWILLCTYFARRDESEAFDSKPHLAVAHWSLHALLLQQPLLLLSLSDAEHTEWLDNTRSSYLHIICSQRLTSFGHVARLPSTEDHHGVLTQTGVGATTSRLETQAWSTSKHLASDNWGWSPITQLYGLHTALWYAALDTTIWRNGIKRHHVNAQASIHLKK